MVALAAACVVLRIDRADLEVPFSYSSDALIQAAWAKTLVEHGWIHRNPSLAAPFGQTYYDFPLFESVNFLAQKALGRIGGWAFAVNAYYLLTFPAAAVCAYVALVALDVSALSAAMASVAYALLPYHFYHGEVGLFLSGYHFVPLAALVAIWVARGDLPSPGRRALRSPRSGIAAVVMVLAAGSGIYYAFFTAWLLVVATLYAGVRVRSWRPAIAAGPLLAILVTAGILNVAPSIAYWRANGMTPAVVRSPSESVFYGFRLASALLPIPDHRIPALSRLRWAYTRAVAPVIDHDYAASSMGIVASLGLLAILGLPFFASIRAGPRDTLRAVACLAWASVLLATTGGLGQIFAVFVTPDIRCWERIVPFLGFFALAAVATGLDRVGRRAPSRTGFAVGVAALGVVAVLDQTSPAFAPDYDRAAAATRSDRAFFGDIQAELPAGAMVFQLPYVAFPESRPLFKLRDYDLLRPYLATTTLRWSYGGVRTRFADAWVRTVAARPVPELVDALVLAGFRGVVVDGRGWADDGAAIDGALRPLADPVVRRSLDGRYTWYGLDGRAAALRSSIGDAEWTRRATALLHPFYIEWQEGFYDREGTDATTNRWAAAASALAVDNPRAVPIRARLTAYICTGWPEPAVFAVRSRDVDATIAVDSRCAAMDVAATLPPGRTRFHFETNAPAVNAPADPRRLHVAWRDVRLVVDDVAVDALQNR